MTATRRSVIFSSDGFDAVRTFWVSASRSSWVTRLFANAAPARPALAVRKKSRRSAPRADSARLTAGFMATSFPNGRPGGFGRTLHQRREKEKARERHRVAHGPLEIGSWELR